MDCNCCHCSITFWASFSFSLADFNIFHLSLVFDIIGNGIFKKLLLGTFYASCVCGFMCYINSWKFTTIISYNISSPIGSFPLRASSNMLDFLILSFTSLSSISLFPPYKHSLLHTTYYISQTAKCC